MSEWRQIETAPKDGSEILLCKATDADGNPITDRAWGIFVQRAAWWAGENGGDGDWIVYCSQPLDPPLFFDPTHWMPLPPPPTEK